MTRSGIHLTPWFRSLRVAAWCLVLLPISSARSAPPRLFDIPAGEATETLKQFAAQAQREIMFSPEVVRGVQTNAVKGRLSERDALVALLADTGLAAVRDQRSGALVIKPRPARPPRLSTDPPPDPNPMKKPRTLFVRALAALSFVTPTFAQEPSPGAPAEGPVVTLSPFEVNADADRGFIATSSLAGGRLAGDLKDTPVAYSVMTREFIDALQLNDLTEMSRWSVNSTDIEADGTTFNTGNGIRIATRGVGSGSPQRNFFPVTYNFDSYNIERLDLARGPNAILFGNSGVGGTTNSITKRARTDRTFSEMRAAAGSWDNYRFTFDHNQRLTDSVALRFNALYQDRKGWRDGDVQTRKGATLAGTWKPFRNTEIRAEVESGQLARAVIVTAFVDNLSGWNGTSTYNARIAAAQNANGITRIGARRAVFTPTNGNLLLNYEGWATTQGGNAAVSVPAGGVLVVGGTANINNQAINEQVNLPANLYDRAVAGSNFEIPARTASAFPDGKIFQVDNDDYTLSLTQRVGDNFFVEVAANRGAEDTVSDIGITRSMSRINIDVNSVLPNGLPNPNFLEPYIESTSYPYLQLRERTNFRAALGYVRNQTRWGDFAFNMIAGQSTNKIDRNAFRYNLKSHADPRQWPSFAPVYYRYYMNTDTSRPVPRPDTWQYIDPITNTTTTVPAGLVRDYTNTSFNQVNETDYQYVQAAATAKLFKNRLNLVAAVRRDKYKTHQDSIVLQFDNPADWDGYTRVYKPAAPADWATLTYRERDASGNPIGGLLPAETRPRAGNLRDPRYASDRFQDDYSPPDLSDTVDTLTYGGVFHVTKHVSLFANFAQSFQPPSVALKIDGSLLKPVAAEGVDYGVRFTLFDGDVVASIARYTGSENGGSEGSPPYQQNFNQIIGANALGDLVSDRNSRGLLPLPQGYVDTAAVQTEGWEFELNANLARNVRLKLNAALPESTATGANIESLQYWEKNYDILKQIVIDAGGSFVGEVATYTGVPPPGQSVTEGQNAVAAWNGNVAAFAGRADGQKLERLTEVTANLYVDYQVEHGWFRGLRIGAGANYRGKQVIGNRGGDTIRNPANAALAIDDPAAGPFDYVYSDPYTVAVLTFNYSKRFRKKYTVSFDLKVDNVFDYDKPLYYNTILRPPGGDLTNPARVATPSRFSWVMPRNYTLTTTLKF